MASISKIELDGTTYQLAPSIGMFIQGISVTASSLANGATGKVGYINIPEKGIWILTASGWWPTQVTSGYIDMPSVATTGTTPFEFSISGIYKCDNPTTVNLNIINWSGKTVTDVSIAGLIFRGVKVGLN